ncbi:hypothetical protein P691DRAFT_160879 [Macrolepiota fuliginosa MF-IS2]|uniref:GRF-type domain-containing protein n=1 Tax=Macrolepiota fuliginosa MF-IS2 TaxID=1400762 RepID=A0A9P5XKS3_9AGAR|nr:hypothetical protein P691DRAFT_160879 [Macrolepiota fuliginosa MF-IS2]
MVTQQVSPFGPNGIPFCHVHNIDAVLRTSHTITNRQRQFYTCPLNQNSERNACRCFYWVDELPPISQIDLPSTPTRSPTSTRFLPLATPTSPNTHNQPDSGPWPSSPTKRGSPFITTEARQKRFKAIQGALEDEPRPGPSSSARPTFSRDSRSATTSTTVTPATPQSVRAKRLAQSIKEALRTPQSPTQDVPTVNRAKDRSTTPTPATNGPPRASGSGTTYRLSDLGLDLSPTHSMHQPQIQNSPGSAGGARSGSGSQYYSPQDTSPRDRDDASDGSRKSEDELWNALAPPPCSQDEVAASLLCHPDKGKGKQKVEGSETEDDEITHWFQNVPPTSGSPGLFTPFARSTSPVLITPSETSNSNVIISDVTSDKIQHFLSSAITGLSIIPDYVRRLERKLAAMEKSNAAKAKRITELEEEIWELKSQRGASANN